VNKVLAFREIPHHKNPRTQLNILAVKASLFNRIKGSGMPLKVN